MYEERLCLESILRSMKSFPLLWAPMPLPILAQEGVEWGELRREVREEF